MGTPYIGAIRNGYLERATPYSVVMNTWGLSLSKRALFPQGLR